MSNTIKVTACDNELIIIAYQWGASFELMRILSGNYNSVNVTINIQPGQYTGPIVINGVNSSLSGSYDVYLANGDYSVVFLGLDWGGPQGFKVKFNGNAYNSVPSESGEGLVWNTPPIALTV